MSKELKAIETLYNGYRFRSRLEARWAVFFDEMGIKYEYEPEGLDVNGIKYLPDFYLPESKSFFEVKGIMNDKDQEKIDALINAGYSVTVGYSDFTFKACSNFDEGFGDLAGGYGAWLCKCHKCGKYWFMGDCGSWECQCCGYHDGDSGFTVLMDGDGDINDDDTEKAINKAKQARFEHGESPSQNKNISFAEELSGKEIHIHIHI